MPPHARAVSFGRGHRFAAYPRCSTDHARLMVCGGSGGWTMTTIAAGGNTVVPAILALEDAGFTVSVQAIAGQTTVSAVRDGEIYTAADPVAVLGLVKLVELRGEAWRATDDEIASTMARHRQV
jgi:hypothetical protein